MVKKIFYTIVVSDGIIFDGIDYYVTSHLGQELYVYECIETIFDFIKEEFKNKPSKVRDLPNGILLITNSRTKFVDSDDFVDFSEALDEVIGYDAIKKIIDTYAEGYETGEYSDSEPIPPSFYKKTYTVVLDEEYVLNMVDTYLDKVIPQNIDRRLISSDVYEDFADNFADYLYEYLMDELQELPYEAYSYMKSVFVYRTINNSEYIISLMSKSEFNELFYLVMKRPVLSRIKKILP